MDLPPNKITVFYTKLISPLGPSQPFLHFFRRFALVELEYHMLEQSFPF
jgi:hypothetical protein